MNCIVAHANPKYPVTAEARAMSPLSNCLMRLGKTGAIMPNARKSSATVTIIKINAA